MARRSRGAGSGGVVCQLQSVFAARVGWTQLVHAPLPPLLADLPCSAPRDMHALGRRRAHAPAAQSQPPLPGCGLPRACLWSDGLVLWWPVAFCHAGSFRGLAWVGPEAHLAAGAGCVEEPVSGTCKAVRKFCWLRPGLGLCASWALLLFHSLVPAVSRSPRPPSRSCSCLFPSPGS